MGEKRLKLLSQWRRVVERAARAVKSVYPHAEVYLFGGAAEGRLTVLSDIDVAVVFDVEPRDRPGVVSEIWEALEREEIPLYYPLEVHVFTRKEFSKIKEVKVKLA